jgi:Flp pilus assembly protein TadG
MIKAIRIARLQLRREDGQSIVEFAFVMPFLVFLILAICQFGLAFHDYISITDAARVGARAAAVNRATPTGPCQSAKNAIRSTVSATQWNTISTRITCNPSTPGPVGSAYTISIGYPVKIGLPGIPGFAAMHVTKTMTASSTERLE